MKPSIVIADLDGTIALIDHRRHWLDPEQHPELGTDERWRKFFADCVYDEPNKPVIAALGALADAGYRIHIFSGRSDEVKEETLAWLKNWGVVYHSIRMRPAGDFTPDEQMKFEWFKEGYHPEDILCVFDDRDKVVRMWRVVLGLTCFQVAPGDF